MILIGLGANLPSSVGEPAATLQVALNKMRSRNLAVAKVSPFYRSLAWPNPTDPPFVNAVAQLHIALTPQELLQSLQKIEYTFGRTRKVPNAPRTLDLDILDFDGRVEPGPPTLPHPRIDARAFVLFPLRDVAPRWRHPISGLEVSELIARLPQETPAPVRL